MLLCSIHMLPIIREYNIIHKTKLHNIVMPPKKDRFTISIEKLAKVGHVVAHTVDRHTERPTNMHFTTLR